MTKIINIKTGVERTIEPPKLPKCEICSYEFNEKKEGGITGSIGRLPVAFCNMCVTGIVKMLVDRQNEEE